MGVLWLRFLVALLVGSVDVSLEAVARCSLEAVLMTTLV